MALLTRGQISRAGVAENLQAVTASDTFQNDGDRTFLDVDNADVAVTNVTFDLATDPNDSEATQDSSTPTVLAVAAGTRERFGPFPTAKFGTVVTVNFSNITSVTAEPVYLPSA